MLNHIYASLKVGFQHKPKHIAASTRAKLEITFEAKVISILNHTLGRLKRSLALGTKKCKSNLPQRSYPRVEPRSTKALTRT